MKGEKVQHQGVADVVSLRVTSEKDIIKARECARQVAFKIGFDSKDRTLIATAVSEICRNVIEHAERGEIMIESLQDDPCGIRIIVRDDGLGIENIDRAMRDGFSSGDGMGFGLPGAKRIMDEFKINSERGKGTEVIMAKWLQ